MAAPVLEGTQAAFVFQCISEGTMASRTFLAGAVSLGALAASAATAEELKSLDQIIVTASPIERTVGETIINTSVLEGEALSRRIENSIGETLRREPGVTSTFFGPGSSRPVIRGLGGDRIRVLDSGIGSIDASATSPDHAVSVDPALAQRIEIVRGPAMLLYGSSAAGGVINVLSGRIPRAAPENGVEGALRIGGGTVDDSVESAGGFNISLGRLGGGELVFHGDGVFRRAEDYSIPGFAESERLRALEAMEDDDHGAGDEDEEEAFGTVENSFLETKGGSAGLSFVFGSGFIGISATGLDTNYGVPGAHAHGHEDEDDDHGGEEEEEEEGGVTIDLRQRRIDLDGEIAADLGLFSKARFRLGYADYEHAEIEPSGEPGTVFANAGWEGRLEFVNKAAAIGAGTLNGAFGAQIRKRDFSAVGEEAFVPPTETLQFGLFAVEDYEIGDLRFEVGARYEHTRHEAPDPGIERDFDGVSVSGGVGWTPTDTVFLGVTGFRTERAPSTEELFSNGPHLATQAFEIGDPDLGEEVGRGVEATARFKSERLVLSLSGFYTSYRDFIFEALTGDEEDGLPVFQFLSADAAFRGLEAQAEAELFQWGGLDFHADASMDYVRATTDDPSAENLPRIPPLSGLVGLEAGSEALDLRLEMEFAARQDDIAAFELPTDGYQAVHAYLTLRPFRNARGLALNLAGPITTAAAATRLAQQPGAVA